MPDAKPDFYEVLHIHPSAPPEVVRAAYRQLAQLYHPDKNPSPEATALMAQVNAAYEVLNDPEKRAAYDRERVAQARQSAPPPPPDPKPPAGRRRRQWAGYPRGTRTGSRTGAGFITLGSTKEEVQRVGGMPGYNEVYPNLGEETWYFDSVTSVTFGLHTERVRAWRNPKSLLRIRLVPGPNITAYDFFEKGDHRDEVARLQGTPPLILVSEALNRELWGYQGGTVEFNFSTGRVVDWKNEGGLKVRRYPQWEFFTGDTGSNDVGVSVLEPDDDDGLLIVRFYDRKLEIVVCWLDSKLPRSSQLMVNWQIDNGPVCQQMWSTATGREGVFMPPFQIPEMLQALMNAETFAIRVVPLLGTPQSAVFRVNGFATAVKPVLDAWRRAGSPVPGRAGGCLLPVLGVAAVAVAVPVIAALL